MDRLWSLLKKRILFLSKSYVTTNEMMMNDGFHFHKVRKRRFRRYLTPHWSKVWTLVDGAVISSLTHTDKRNIPVSLDQRAAENREVTAGISTFHLTRLLSSQHYKEKRPRLLPGQFIILLITEKYDGIGTTFLPLESSQVGKLFQVLNCLRNLSVH